MATDVYDYQRDDRLDLFESEASLTSTLERLDTHGVYHVRRVADRILETRGVSDTRGDRMLGFAFIGFAYGLVMVGVGYLAGAVL